MNLALIILFYILMGSPTSWANPKSEYVRIDSVISSRSVDDLQQVPYGQRDFKFLFSPSLPFTDPFYQTDITKVQDNLRSNLRYFSSPSFHPPDNLSSSLKGYLAHTPQDTQFMIDKLDSFKINPGAFYGGYDFSGLTSPRSWHIYPQELPKNSEFTPQEQLWEQKNIPFGRLGISQEYHQWSYGLSTYDKNNWEWQPSYKIGESLGINGPILAFGKTSQGPDIFIYGSNGNFIGDVTPTKLNVDPLAPVKYLLKADDPNAFGPSHPYDRSVPADDFNPQAVMVLPQGQPIKDFLADLEYFKKIDYEDEFWEQYWDCDDDDYYYFNQDECDDFYDFEVPPYDFEKVLSRSVLRDPDDPLYPNPKPKKQNHSLFGSILVSIVPLGNGGVGLPQDSSNNGEVNVIDQYSLPQIGFTDKSDPHSAWNAVDTKGPNVLVAVIDSGMYLEHPDGPEFIWQNPADGSHGWNFLDENTDLRDLHDHGTLIAGIIAAKTNNGIGMAGINAGAVIMPLKVADKNGNANSLNIYRAIHYAVDHGARVINISLGSSGVSKLENLAINYAHSHNVLVVIASGNSDDDIGTFGPSSSGGAIAVGALNYDGSLATISNWGANNSLMAPGEQIFSLHSKDAPWDGPVGQRERLYTKESGTSFSAPMVAATASLLLVKHPDLTAAQLEDILMSSAKPSGPERWNGLNGAGLLDAAAALRTDPQSTFNVKITRIRTVYKDKKLDYVDVYATVRGDVDYFTVEVGIGKHAHNFKPVMGISAQEANDDLVAHIPNTKLRGSKDWILLVRATDKPGKEYEAKTVLTIK